MMFKRRLAAVVIDERTEWTLGELSQVCRVDRQTLVALVEAGILVPKAAGTREAEQAEDGGAESGRAAARQADWRFPGEGLARVQRALRVSQGLDLDPHATAVVLALLEEIERLRARLRQFGA